MTLRVTPDQLMVEFEKHENADIVRFDALERTLAVAQARLNLLIVLVVASGALNVAAGYLRLS